MEKKNWCVRVYEEPHDLEDIMTATSQEAEKLGVQRFLAENSDKYWHNISWVEVMRHCECGYDNDTEGTECDECGANL